MAIRICEICGIEFYKRPSGIIAKGGRFCSRKCWGVSCRTHVEKVCEICDKKFYVNLYKATIGCGRFCSHKCMGISTRGSGHVNWQGGRMVACEVCGEEFYVTPAKFKRGHGRFCSRKCRGLGFMGERSVNWKGGKSFEPYPPEFNDHFKQMIRKRDSFTCAVCRLPGDGIHHINYVKDDTTSENCITLCQNCHGVTGGNREYWMVTLNKLMEARGYVTH